MAKKVARKKKSSKKQVSSTRQDEFKSRNAKRIFFIFLDVVILIAFSLAIYFTLVMDYESDTLPCNGKFAFAFLHNQETCKEKIIILYRKY